MRTTIDIDDLLLRRLRDAAHRERVSFRALLHRIIQRGLDEATAVNDTPYEAPSFAMGAVPAHVDLAKALALASAFEDEETALEIARRR